MIREKKKDVEPTLKAKSGKKTGADASREIERFKTRVWELGEQLCSAEGLELVHVEYQKESMGRVLRIYIDKPGGTTLDDCVAVSRQLGDLLDVYMEGEHSYRLEVSSPGVERPIGKISDYDRFKGCSARIRTTEPLAGRKNFTGILKGIVDDSVMLLLGTSETVAIPFEKIRKARLINQDGAEKCISQT